MRTLEDIEKDLATEEGQGGLTRQSPIGRLVADVPALLAEVLRLRAFDATSKARFAELRRQYLAELAELRRQYLAELAEARTLAATRRTERDAARTKVRAAELLHCWTNEDGRRFVFADDLATALGIPS